MIEPHTEAVIVRPPFARGDQVAWRAVDGTLQEGGLVVEQCALSLAVYAAQNIYIFNLRADGKYWGSWCEPDEAQHGFLLRVTRTRGGAE